MHLKIFDQFNIINNQSQAKNSNASRVYFSSSRDTNLQLFFFIASHVSSPGIASNEQSIP